MASLRSWGMIPSQEQSVVMPQWRHNVVDVLATTDKPCVLAYGRGRSYGDSCLNSSGKLVHTTQLNHVLDFDPHLGVITCESGISFVDILDVIIPCGWFVPVTPGTRFITLGGAIANDVHGKNHHAMGSFGCYVSQFELLRSNGERLVCSRQENADVFMATIGGLGLTGLIGQFRGLDEFMELSAETAKEHTYSVAWLDCVGRQDREMRGLFYAANHRTCEEPVTGQYKVGQSIRLKDFQFAKPRLNTPFNMPRILLNKYSVKAFNEIYYRSSLRNEGKTSQSIEKYFYPLDGLNNWNRIYGREGFVQYQFVIPKSNKALLSKILTMISLSGSASFLTVLKEFGDTSSGGLLSFPREGICLALDFTNQNAVTMKLMDEIDDLLVKVEGAVYPAKDRRMSEKSFKRFYPRYSEFKTFIDPAFCSDFWRRVNGT